MLNPAEKKHIKDVLSDGLGINRNINLPYFLDKILDTGDGVEEIKSRIRKIEYNQEIIERKLDMIIRLIGG